jgi:hypothetical protein
MQGRHKKTENDLSIEERICLHGYFVDASNLDDCYKLCHRESKATDEYIHALALRWVRKGSPQRNYLDSLNKRLVIVGKLSPDGKDKSAESEYIDFNHFYLPLTCKRCNLYCAGDGENAKKNKFHLIFYSLWGYLSVRIVTSFLIGGFPPIKISPRLDTPSPPKLKLVTRQSWRMRLTSK